MVRNSVPESVRFFCAFLQELLEIYGMKKYLSSVVPDPQLKKYILYIY
jgi:hypothetical protein